MFKNAGDIPELRLEFPSPVRILHQVELTSRCSLRCKYCPSRDIVDGKYPNRSAVDMTEEHFRRALCHVVHYASLGQQIELNVAGIGESMLLPHFIDFMEIARAVLGPEILILLATNGLHMTDEKAKRMAELRVICWISYHLPEKAGPAVQIAKRHGIWAGRSTDPVDNSDDWAGQVKWDRSQDYVAPCMWMRDQRAMALADGRITACCLDASGAGVIGHVDDPVGSLTTKPYGLCSGCAQEVRVAGYTQRPSGAQ